MSEYENLMASSIPTRALASGALNFYEFATPYAKPLWMGIASDEADARAYYASLDEEMLRSEACEILANGGWTVHAVNFKRS